MREAEMTPFERRLADRLRAHSSISVPPANPRAIAHDIMAEPRRVGLGGWFASLRGPVRLGLVAALLAAAMLGLLAVSGALRTAPLLDASPHPASPSPGPAASPADLALHDGVWLADKPAEMAFGPVSGPARLALTFDANVASMAVTASSTGDVPLVESFAEQSAGEISLQTRTATGPIQVGGAEVPGCAVGDEAVYRFDFSPDGLGLTFSTVSDACAARSAMLARTWIRSLGGVSNGGLGVVTAGEQLLSVTLPAGSYAVERAAGAITIAQPSPELAFLVVEDPQGFLDPCDVAAGREVIEARADAFVAYFRRLPGFTVDSSATLVVDGHRAVHLVVHANLDASCPSGRLYEWQAKVETTDHAWFLRPGDVDSLYLVELPDSLVLIELLPPPHPSEDAVIGSIRFLDGLPTP